MKNLGNISDAKDVITKEYLEDYVADNASSGGDGMSATDVVNLIYPVGSIYMGVNNVNPGTFFGGTWVQWGAGKAVMGVNTSDADFNSAEKTGGAKNHTLSVAELPSHNHTFSGSSGSAGAHTHGLKYTGSETAKGTGHGWINNDGASTLSSSVKSAGAHTHSISGTIDNTGGGSAFSILPPYITCYMWKRTA